MPKILIDSNLYDHFKTLMSWRRINEKLILDDFASKVACTPFEIFRKNKKQVRVLAELMFLAYTSKCFEFLKAIVLFASKHHRIITNLKQIIDFMFPSATTRSDYAEKDAKFVDMVMWIIRTFKHKQRFGPVYEHILCLRPSIFLTLQEDKKIMSLLGPLFLVGLINASDKNDASIQYARAVMKHFGVDQVLTCSMLQTCLEENNVPFLKMLKDDLDVKFDFEISYT